MAELLARVPFDTPCDDAGRPIVYDTNEVDELTHALTGDEGEDDSVTVLRRFAAYVENVWPGKTAMQVLIELEEGKAGVLGTHETDELLPDDLCDAYGVPRGSRRGDVTDDSGVKDTP